MSESLVLPLAGFDAAESEQKGWGTDRSPEEELFFMRVGSHEGI